MSAPVGHPDEMPQGYYGERYLDQHQDYQYRYVHQDCPWSGLHMAQLPEVQSNASVDPDRASLDYRLIIQKRTRDGWRIVERTKTFGPRDRRTIDLPRGKYRALVVASSSNVLCSGICVFTL